MKRREFVLIAVLLLAATGTFLVSCGPATTQQASGNSAPTDTAEQASAAPPEPPPQAPAVSDSEPAPQAQNPPAAPPPSRTVRKTEMTNQARSESVAPAVPPQPAAPVAPPPPVVKTLPAGTSVALIFLDGLSSETSQQGDTFRARVAQDITHDGLLLIPSGSVVTGSVTEAVPLKKIGGTAKLSLAFRTIEIPTGGSVAIEASLTAQGKSETKKDAATIGGATAGGALLGRLVGDDKKGALIGAVVGGAAGTAIAAKTKGEQVEIPVGTERTIELNRPVDITFRR